MENRIQVAGGSRSVWFMSDFAQHTEFRALHALQLKPTARLLLWRLVAVGGGEWISWMRSAPSPGLREEVVATGLMRSEIRRNRETGRQGTWIELTDAGWDWARLHMGDDLGGASAASDALTVFLRGLRHFLALRNLTVEDAFRGSAESGKILPFPGRAVETGYPGGSLAAVWDRDAGHESDEVVPLLTPLLKASIIRAYLRITRGRFRVRVRLADLRLCFTLEPSEMDLVLRRLAGEGHVELIALSPPEVTDADREAAVWTGTGEIFHAVWLEERKEGEEW